MRIEPKHTKPWPWANRPRDYKRDTIELRFEGFDYMGGPLPRRIWVRDPDFRGCWYRATEMLILEPITRRMCLMFSTHEHSWDDMPQLVVARDGWGNEGTYVPVDPRVTKIRAPAICPYDLEDETTEEDL